MMSANTTNKRICVHRTPSSSSLESNLDDTTTTTTVTTVTTANASTAVNPTHLSNLLSNLPQSTPSTDLTTLRLSYYLEQSTLAHKSANTTQYTTTTTRAKDLIRRLHPSSSTKHHQFIYATQSAYYARKHSLPPSFARDLLEETPLTSLSTEDLARLSTATKACYWIHLGMCLLELGELEKGEVCANAVITVLEEAGEGEGRGYFEAIAYFMLAVLFVKRGDLVEAAFWKGLVDERWEVPEMVWVRGEEKGEFDSVIAARGGSVGGEWSAVPAPIKKEEVKKEVKKEEVKASGGSDGALREYVGGLHKDFCELSDTVAMNYRELCERIKSIHRIMDEKEKSDGEKERKVRRVGIIKTDAGRKEPVPASTTTTGAGAVSSSEVEELKRKVEYLERTLLR